MNPKKSNIKAGFYAKGQCDICGKPASLIGEDQRTLQKAGNCCLSALIFADSVLSTWGPWAGIVHPERPHP